MLFLIPVFQIFEQSQSESSENSTTESDERSGTSAGATHPATNSTPASTNNNDLYRFAANRNSIAERRRLYEGFAKKTVSDDGAANKSSGGAANANQVPLLYVPVVFLYALLIN